MAAKTRQRSTNALRALLAAAVRGERLSEQDAKLLQSADEVIDAVRYHGLAGLLLSRADGLSCWPTETIEAVREQARAEAMWELRHRDLLCKLLAELSRREIDCLLLKGSALAYEFYAEPAMRPRGDTDLLVAPQDVEAVRTILRELGFVPFAAGRGLEWLQQSWTFTRPDGSRHLVDLHWAPLNAPALAHVLPTLECMANARPLHGLCPGARSMDRARMLVHLCLHRLSHRTAPYLVGDRQYFGGDRLIWSFDISLVAAAMGEEDWQTFLALAGERRVAGACVEGLEAAAEDFGVSLPAHFLPALRCAASRDLPYLHTNRALVRALLDWRAMPGLGSKLDYLFQRMSPDPAFLRAKYPRMARWPLPLLHLRRMAGALLARGKRHA